MFTPNEIEAIPLKLERQFTELESRIMQDIVRRVKDTGEITRAADWQIHRLSELGKSKKEVKHYIKNALQLSKEKIDSIYSDVIASGYARDAQLYTSSGRALIPFSENKPLKQLIESISEQTEAELKNITQSIGFAVRQASGKLRFTPIADYYQKTLDGAVLDITSGAFDYNTVLKRIVREMTDSGLRSVDYASGRSNRLDVAARRAVMTGVNQVTAKINEDNAKLLNTDMFETTWHSGARPTHQIWQGKWFDMQGLKDICGYGKVDGLKGANCRHDFFAVIPGVSEPTYTSEQLEEMNRKENIPIEYKGKQYTKYEALQKQRRLETTMRAQRQKIKLLEDGGADEEDITTARARYHVTSSEYSRFSEAMNLPQQRERVTVDGLENIGVGKYVKPVANSAENGIINIQVNERDIQAINRYISSDSYKINEKLRSGTELSNDEKEFIRDLDNALEKIPSYEGTVYRSIRSDMISDIQKFWELHKPGKYIQYSTYISSSLEIYDDTMDIQYIIESKNGKNLTTINSNEQEVLFKKDTCFIITKIEDQTIYMKEG